MKNKTDWKKQYNLNWQDYTDTEWFNEIKEFITEVEEKAYERGYFFAKSQQDQKITLLMQDVEKIRPQERVIEEIIKSCAKENSCSMCKEYLGGLKK